MFTFLRNKYSGILKRIKCASIGLLYLKNSDFKITNQLKISGKYKDYKFLDKDNPRFIYEFTEICLNDCYRLRLLSRRLNSINSIVDVGANQGLFAIAARQQFPNANIHCYEPNLFLKENLSHNADNLSSTLYIEAVTKDDCKVNLEFGETDLLTKTSVSTTGTVQGTSLRTVIENAGGEIDILKLDCEGAEWDLFDDEFSWQKIKGLTMEYHLWAREGSSFEDIEFKLARLNFKILSHEALNDSYGLVTAVNQTK
ncbi:hypothetical protein BH11BAC5_BH11BAC5_30120 [soil metagenome]